MPEKFERCVRKVRAQNKGKKKKGNPYAVCTVSLGMTAQGKPRKKNNPKKSRKSTRKSTAPGDRVVW